MDPRYTPLLSAPAPVVTVLIDARSDQPNALQQLELRWKNVRRDLEAAGADEATLDAVEASLTTDGSHGGGDSIVVVAAGGEVLLRQPLPDPPPGDVDQGHVGPVAHLLPVVMAEQSAVPHVVVLADKVGADLYGRTGPTGHGAEDQLGGDATIERNVDGDEQNVQRSAPGGWSQRRFQQRAENTWERNAGEAAEEVVALAEEIGAELVVLGGDVRATGFLLEALPDRVRSMTRSIDDASRAEGASIEHIADDVHRLVRTVAAERLTGVLATFDEELGQHDRAADGPAAVVTALQMATVETLLVSSRGVERAAWVGPQPEHLALDRNDLTAGMGVEDPVEAPLVDACIRAALGTGARVVVVPSTKVKDGIGAILRHSGATPDTPGGA